MRCSTGAELGGYRTVLAVPLLREGGAGRRGRRSRAPRSGRSRTSRSSWSTTFADQAVIAIENVRLFDEVQARTRDLTEALEQQTATSEVLRVISSSPGELMPVFQSILANATRLCEAQIGNLHLCEGDALRIVAMHNSPPRMDRVSAAKSGSSPRPRYRAWPGNAHQADRSHRRHYGGSDRTGTIRFASRSPSSSARGPFWRFRCSRTTGWSARSSSTG